MLDIYRLHEPRLEPSVIYDGDGVYHEVGVDILANAGGLEQVAEFLFVAQKKSNEIYGDEMRQKTVKCTIL